MGRSHCTYARISLLATVILGTVAGSLGSTDSLANGEKDTNATSNGTANDAAVRLQEAESKSNNSDEMILAESIEKGINIASVETTNASDQVKDFRASLEHLDGRSAYSNSQYLTHLDSRPDSTPPLYQLLQQQMEQVLASTGSEYGVYSGNHKHNHGQSHPTHKKLHRRRDDTSSGQVDDVGEEDLVVQIPPKKPLFQYSSNEDVEDYAEETVAESDGDDDVEVEPGYAVPISLKTTHRPLSTLPPVTVTAPKTTTTTSSTRTTTRMPATGKITMSTSSPTQNHTSAHKQKRRITFKTVATASQFVSTPLADLMLKFSIGLAKPSNPSMDNFHQQTIGDGETTSGTPHAAVTEKSHLIRVAQPTPSPYSLPQIHPIEAAKSETSSSIKHHRHSVVHVHNKKKPNVSNAKNRKPKEENE